MTNPIRCVAVAAALGLGGAGAGAIAQTRLAGPVRVHVSPPEADSAIPAQDLRDREASAKDLEMAIGAKEDWLQVVDSADGADAVLEIVDRASSRSGATLRAAMRIGSYERELVASVSSRRTAAVWAAAAEELARRLERWVKANHAIVTARRSNPDLDIGAALAAERTRVNTLRATTALRKLGAAQDAYASFNQGLFGPLECLHSPVSCVPTVGSNSPLLRPRDLTVRGFIGTFYPGAEPARTELRRLGAGSGSLQAWAYYFDPEQSLVDAPSLCADSTGRLCRLTGAAATPRRSSCPAVCEDLK